MDGNGRWAEQRGVSRAEGHRAGTENIRQITRTLAQRGVRYVTLYAFSTENWRRSRQEVQSLFRILADAIDRETDTLNKENVRVVHVGRLDRINPLLRRKIARALERTQHNTGITLAVAFDYGGRDEIVEAARRIMKAGLSPDQVTEEVFSSYLYTGDMPDPDLIVRTAGEMRLSNFLIWQAAYAEYYSTPTLWPDFDAAEVDKALDAFKQRKRKFGARPLAKPTV